MPERGEIPAASRGIRIFRLAAALSVLVALVALVTLLRGDVAGKAHALILVAVFLGGGALIGMAVMALPHIHRQKDKNDPRS